MRHRMTSVCTGLGNPDKELLDNSGKINKEFADAVINTYMPGESCDFKITDICVMAGIEPAYMYQRLKIVCIFKEKEYSYIQDGYAFGMYGSGIVKKIKWYKDYKRKCKFVNFVDKWHKVLW